MGTSDSDEVLEQALLATEAWNHGATPPKTCTENTSVRLRWVTPKGDRCAGYPSPHRTRRVPSPFAASPPSNRQL